MNMVPLHHQTKLKTSGEDSPPVPPPPTTKGGGVEDAPIENCAKKRRVGTTIAHLYTPSFTEVTSLWAPLAIEGHIYGYGEEKPAPVTVKIEGAQMDTTLFRSQYKPDSISRACTEIGRASCRQ